MFSIDDWDSLAKIGKYKVDDKEMQTPALFPVVDPRKQDVKISEMKKYGFDQVITSAYLMSKRYQGTPIEEYPQIHKYLDYDGMVMMDSGAYQIMLYDDIDLGVLDTLKLQKHVKTNIGVIMDHPIGYKVSHHEAEKRIQTTLERLKQSIPHFEGSNVQWTLPIQGGRYIDLLSGYLDTVTQPDILKHFNFYALGSVVQVMINQDYESMVKMIAMAREKLPVTFPLHLFGAGHPSMFALATFLGIDTFDSAAYILMANDFRYMTVEGTYQLTDLHEFPCSCRICTSYTPKELRSLPRNQQRTLLAEHNLYVSAAEIRRIRNAIRYGRLWDLVQQRAAAVPNLARGTRMAMEYVQTGKLGKLMSMGTPETRFIAPRVARHVDFNKPEISRTREAVSKYLAGKKYQELILITYSLQESIYNKIDNGLLSKLDVPESSLIAYLLPPFGIVPYGITDLYPIGQLVMDIEPEQVPMDYILQQMESLKSNGLEKVMVLEYNKYPLGFLEKLLSGIARTEILTTRSPITELKEHFRD